jgi:hypothetical protein
MFALLQCGLVIRTYTNLIRVQTLQFADEFPFKPDEIIQVLKETRYSVMIEDKYQWWYQVCLDF